MTINVTKSQIRAVVAEMPLPFRIINFFLVPFGRLAVPRLPLVGALGCENPWLKRLKGGAL